MKLLLISVRIAAAALFYRYFKKSIRYEVKRSRNEEEEKWLSSLRGSPAAFAHLPEPTLVIRRISVHGELMRQTAAKFPHELQEIRTRLELELARAITRRDEFETVLLTALIKNVEAAKQGASSCGSKI